MADVKELKRKLAECRRERDMLRMSLVDYRAEMDCQRIKRLEAEDALAECRKQLTAKVENKHSEPDELRAEALHSDDRFHPTAKTMDRVKAELAECREALKETGQEKRHAQEFAAKKARELAKMRVALQECREALAAARCEAKDYQRLNRIYRERLAAAEAKLSRIAHLDDNLPYICGDENGDCFWDHAQRIASTGDHTALDAALEDRTIRNAEEESDGC